jgi:uncharacterized protein YbaR (Trm112 family)
MISKELIAILRCPMSKKQLRLMSPDELRRINRLVQARSITCYDGHRPDLIDEALITVDGKYIYPVRNGVLVMEMWESIEVKVSVTALT